MKRFLLLSAVLWHVHPAFSLPRLEAEHVSLNYVAKKAEARARKPFRSPRADLPPFLTKLTYDDYREIEFRHDRALWTEDRLPFRVEFFHLGYLYQEPVHLNEFTSTHVQSVRFSPDFFDYRSLHLPAEIPANTGYAGFRILNQLNSSGKWDELGSFQGASYFRLLGQGQVYGMSARGLALDCGGEGRPEEFPIFTDWWLGKPQREDDSLLLYAILDSVSCTGAYEFVIHAGSTTVAEIEAILYFRDRAGVTNADPHRQPLQTIGMAPLTSMFWFGNGSERKFNDYRPEVHDSDGLLIHMENGEKIWRPLVNGTAMRHQVFPANNLQGFGLLQRNRDFNHYQDIFHAYQDAPSAWVAPHGSWGAGNVHLVELSSESEGLDNVVAFWDPSVKPAPMQPFHFGYTLYWTREKDMPLSSNEVVDTRVGLNPRDGGQHQFVVDFNVPQLTNESAPPTVLAQCSTNGTITETQVFRDEPDKSWRVFINFLPKPGPREPVDLKCVLKKGVETVSETWSYRWTPP